MVNASVPFAVRARERRNPTAQKRDAYVVKDMVELFLFLSLFVLLFAFLWRGTGGRPGKIDLKGEGDAIGIMRVSLVHSHMIIIVCLVWVRKRCRCKFVFDHCHNLEHVV